MISRRILSQSVASQLLEGKNRTELLRQLAAYIVTNKLENETDLLLADINRELAQKGQVLAHVTTAHAIDSLTRESIASYVREASDANHVTLEEHIDEALIGGAIIETPLARLDVSIASQLKQLRNSRSGEF